MNKAYIDLKSLGTTTREPIYFIHVVTQGKEEIFFSSLKKEKYLVEGHRIADFIKDVNRYYETGKQESETEKDIFFSLLDFLKEENIEEIIVEDKLEQMLLIRERMRINKFKPETYGFRNFKLTEEPEHFTKNKKEQNPLFGLIKEMERVVKREK